MKNAGGAKNDIGHLVNTSMLFAYLNLPKIPTELLEYDLMKIENRENIFRIPEYQFYKQFNILNDDLNNFLRNIFNFEFFAAYQVVRNGIHIHKDGIRTECINYQFDTGGEFNSLNIYDEDKITVLHKENILPNCWHYINVSKYHNVTELTRPRIGISITCTSGSMNIEKIISEI